jgi:hypothetical protein
MRRYITMLGLTLASYAILSVVFPAAANAQVIGVEFARPYTPVYVQPSYLPPVYVNPPGVVYSSPLIAPSYASTISYYPQTAAVYTYSAPPVYAAPVQYAAPASGVVTTYSYRGYGIFRPRGVYTQSYYSPYYP